jgi:hypothetical protein
MRRAAFDRQNILACHILAIQRMGKNMIGKNEVLDQVICRDPFGSKAVTARESFER